MSISEKNKRKVWTIGEIKGLLKCYLARKDEFNHIRKRRNAYAHVLEDMVAQGFISSTTTTVCGIEGKMRTLFSSYKTAKDNAYVSPCIAPYMKELEEIFGDCPLISNTHTLHMGRGPTSSLRTVENMIDLPTSSSPVPYLQTRKTENSSPSPDLLSVYATEPSPRIESPSTIAPPETFQHTILPSSPVASSEKPKNDRKRKTAREIYYEAKLKLKKQISEEKMAQKRQFHDRLIEMIDRNEKEKLRLLKELLNQQVTPPYSNYSEECFLEQPITIKSETVDIYESPL